MPVCLEIPQCLTIRACPLFCTACTAAPGETYEFNAAAFARRTLKNKALVSQLGLICTKPHRPVLL